MIDRIRYRRVRFTTWLPRDRRYTPSHYWIDAVEPGLWRVGFTGFAVRMLGDLVEHRLEAGTGQPVQTGQTIGWIEGFKALSDIYAVMPGLLESANPALLQDVTLFDTRHYDAGWLYQVRAEEAPEVKDVQEYIGLLDATIDRLLAAEDEGTAVE